MARAPRILFQDAWYHIMNRGAGRKDIFYNDEQRNLFLELLSIISTDFEVEIHAFCLMSNHYHLLVKTPAPTLSAAMKFLSATYTRKFNRLTKRDGPLFRSRYKSIVINADSYLAEVSRYIHRNPIEVKIVSNPGDYRWSSYPAYLGDHDVFPWVKTHSVLSKVSSSEQVEAYKNFVENERSASLREFYGASRLPAVLGSKEFGHYISGLGFPDAIRNHKNPQQPTIEEISQSVADYFSVRIESIRESSRGLENIARTAVLCLAKNHTNLTSAELAAYFNVTVPVLRVAMSRSVLRAKSDPRLVSLSWPFLVN